MERNRIEFPERSRAKAIYDAQRPVYEKALQRMAKRLGTLLEKHGHTATVTHRVKRFENYFEKLLKLSRQHPGDEPPVVTDLLGLRVICTFLEDVERIEQLIAQHFEVVEVDRKAGRHSYREFGYDSVHLLVALQPDSIKKPIPYTRSVCEIQLRTILQDAWAEVEHELVYKSPVLLPNESIRRKLAALSATLTLADLIFQEIRDYQKEMLKHARKRRTRFGMGPGLEDFVGLLPAQEGTEPAETEPALPLIGAARSKLEKTLLAALEAHSNGDLEGAVRLYSRILEMQLDPTVRSLIYNHRGMARFDLAEYRQAHGDFSEALRCDPQNVRAYTNRGLTLRVLGDFAASLEDYDHALRIDPSRVESYWGRAQTYSEMGWLTEALGDCEKVLSIQADFGPALDLMKQVRTSLR